MNKTCTANPLLVLEYIIVSVGAAIIAAPIIYMVLCSFKDPHEVVRAFSLPSRLYLGNYAVVFKSMRFLGSVFNSLFVTTMTLALTTVICSLAAYPISRRKEKSFRWIFLFFLSAMMIPTGSNLVSLYVIIKSLNLIDHLSALILLNSSAAVPMGILLYTGFIKTIPKSMDESAIVDGCNYWQRFWIIIFPLLKVVTVAFAVMTCIGVWNDFINPMMFIQSADKNTLTLLVYNYKTEHEVDWGSIYALLTLAFMPPALFFILSQKHFYRGITQGAIKG